MFRNFMKGEADSFDPNMFDPSVMRKLNSAQGSGSTPSSVAVTAKPGQKMQVNIVLNNPTASDLTFELFNYLTSFTRTLNATYVTGNYGYIPLLSYEGIVATAAGTGKTVGFNSAGVLQIHGDDTVPNPIATITCKEVPYSSWFVASSVIPFVTAYMRFTTSVDDQIDQNITWFQKTFSGGVSENTISPRAYFKPNQFQDLTLDITVSFNVGIDIGLKTEILAGQSVRLAFFIMMWTDPNF